MSTPAQIVFSALSDWHGRGASDHEFDAAYAALRVLVGVYSAARDIHEQVFPWYPDDELPHVSIIGRSLIEPLLDAVIE